MRQFTPVKLVSDPKKHWAKEKIKIFIREEVFSQSKMKNMDAPLCFIKSFEMENCLRSRAATMRTLPLGSPLRCIYNPTPQLSNAPTKRSMPDVTKNTRE